jgi:DNA-binding transcriptional MocR family regulator
LNAGNVSIAPALEPHKLTQSTARAEPSGVNPAKGIETMWLPSIADRTGPKYLRIADALAEDIYAGRLAVGERLPTHRDLAWRLGVTVGTVSRAYAEGERRGLLVGEVGRGSFVRAGARSSATLAMPDIVEPPYIELAINRPPAHLVAPEFAAAMAEVAAAPDFEELINYQAHTGRWSHRAAGSAWLAMRGLEAPPDRVLVTGGAQHAAAATLMALADAGETLMVEELTWSGTRALASLLRLSLKPVAMDEHGLMPDAVEAAAKASGARLLYLQPTNQNPTGVTMPDARREEIAAVAARCGLTLVEDDIYGNLDPDPPPPLAAFAPQHTVYITAASKCLAPALRVGFVALPEDRVGRFSAAARATNWMAPPIMTEILARWVADGTARALCERLTREILARQQIAFRLLAGMSYRAAPAGMHLWLQLPEPWRAQDAVAAARAEGVALPATDLFVPGRGETPHAVRLALGATRDHGELERALAAVRRLLETRPEPCLAVA